MAYDGTMAKPEQIQLTEVVADPAAVFERVERERIALSVVRGNEGVALISPAPIVETLAEMHRAHRDGSPDDSFYLDLMETRRMLGL